MLEIGTKIVNEETERREDPDLSFKGKKLQTIRSGSTMLLPQMNVGRTFMTP